MAQTFTSGVKHGYTGSNTGLLYTDRRDFYLDPNKVSELWSDVTPFITFIGKLSTESVKDPDFKMFEHRSKWINQAGFVRTATDWDGGGSFAAAATSKTLYSLSTGTGEMPYVNIGDILEVRAKADGTRNSGNGSSGSVTKDQVIAVVWVTAMTHTASTSSVATISVFSTDGSDVYDLQDGDPFMVIGNAHPEGGTSTPSWADELETVWNSCQIFKTPVEVTGTLMEMSNLRGYNNEFNRLVAEKAKEHKMKENRTLLLGWRMGGNGAPTSHKTGALNSGDPTTTVRTTLGAIPAILKYGTTNEQVFTRQWANYSIDQFIEDMEAMAQYDNAKAEKFAFCGSGVLAEFSKTGPNSFLARSGAAIQLSDTKTTSFGFDVRTLTHPFGQLHFVWDPAMRYDPYKDYAVIIDPDNIGKVMFRSSKYETNIQANDKDGRKDQFFSDLGLKMTMIERHGLLKFA